MPRLSVIIPVYNVENYLEKCVESVIRQDYSDMEIILVDDGSPDQCPAICDRYAADYSWIRVVHKENGGLSSARNTGIREAHGEYIIFLDSDDWWNPEVSVQQMFIQVLSQPDVEMWLFDSCDYLEGSGFLQRKDHDYFREIRTDTVAHYYEDLTKNGNLEVHACTKILKRSFLFEHDLYFKEGLLSEDNEWMLRMLRILRRVGVLEEALYIYRMGRVGSITHTIKKKNITDLLGIVSSSIVYYEKNPEAPYREFELCYAAYLWFSALGLSIQLDRSLRKEVRPIFEETKVVCSYSASRKTVMCNRLMKMIGFQNLTFLLGLYIHLKERYAFNKKKI